MKISGNYGNKQTVNLPLTEEQTSSLGEILGKYDPENMSAEDMKALRQDMAEAGIPRSKATMDYMKEAGFAPRKPLPDAARMRQPSLPESMNESGSDNSGVQQGELWDLYQQMQNGQITEAEFLQRIGGRTSTTGSLIDFVS